MNGRGIAGMILVVLGVAGLLYGGITYTSRETVLDIGPIHATADRQRTVFIPPVLGLLGVVGGAMLLFAGGRARA